MYEVTDVLQRLLEINEFQAICWAAYSICLLLLLGLGGIFVAHSAFAIMGSRVMYRRKQPDSGWSKQFYPAICLLMLVTGAVTWTFWQLANGVIPFIN
ncbi:MAG: hypothetical protein ABIQ64_01455 [Candidatus Saccharimonadales bacterium]